jgi:hypothetical protein
VVAAGIEVGLLPSKAKDRPSFNMPSDLSAWLIAVPNDGDAEGLLPELRQKLEYSRTLLRANIHELAIPILKVCTTSRYALLSTLASLSIAYSCTICNEYVDVFNGSYPHFTGRDFRRLVDSLRRAAQDGWFLHFRCGKGGGHVKEPLEQ